jgi:hypothetical protein
MLVKLQHQSFEIGGGTVVFTLACTHTQTHKYTYGACAICLLPKWRALPGAEGRWIKSNEHWRSVTSKLAIKLKYFIKKRFNVQCIYQLNFIPAYVGMHVLNNSDKTWNISACTSHCVITAAIFLFHLFLEGRRMRSGSNLTSCIPKWEWGKSHRSIVRHWASLMVCPAGYRHRGVGKTWTRGPNTYCITPNILINQYNFLRFFTLVRVLTKHLFQYPSGHTIRHGWHLF